MFDWVKATEGQELPSTEGGASGYMSEPAKTLDPALFDSNEFLKTHAKNAILAPLLAFLSSISLENVQSWIDVWLAGSGITYQWDGDRGNGDLDVMIGMDRHTFNSANPDFEWLGNTDLADWLNVQLKAGLWPLTSHQLIGDKTFEVTYFVTVTDDIRGINPYAAYNVMRNQWVVRPPEHTASHVDFSQDWYDEADNDVKQAQYLSRHYERHLSELQASPAGSPGAVNASAMLGLVSTQASALFDSIHQGRTMAFQGGGRGYMDYHNFRWQQAKANGVVKALKAMRSAQHRAQDASDTEAYGAPLDGPEALVTRAMLMRRTQP